MQNRAIGKDDITIRNCVLSYKGKRIPLIAGEALARRTMKEHWPTILSRVKEMGLAIVSTIIEWDYHEITPGEYDFTGKTSPQRDLKRFIEFTKEKGLYLIVKPGPWVFGPAKRAAKYHRLDPEYLKMAKDWLDNVCRFLAPYQITRGGNIILFQADNEVYPPLETHGDALGCFHDKGLFKEWLRKKYRDNLERLNRSWRADFKSFDEPAVFFHEVGINTSLSMADRLLPYPEYYMRYADSCEFLGWYGAEVAGTVAAWMRAAGVDVPIFANGWSPYFQDFTQLSNVMDLVGADLYPTGFFGRNEASCGDHWLYTMDALKMAEAAAKNGNAWCAELGSGFYSGSMADREPPPQHYRLETLAFMARGLKGWLWHLLADADFSWRTPISASGGVGRHFPIFQEVVTLTKKVEPWRLEELLDLSLGVYKPHRVISPGNFKEMFYALEEADISYDYWDLQAAPRSKNDLLVYSGANWIERDVESKLAGYVEQGGTLVAFNQFPICDEYGDKLQRLRFLPPDGVRPVGLPVDISYKSGSVAIEEAGHCGSKVNFFYYREVSGEPIYLTVSTAAKKNVQVDMFLLAAEVQKNLVDGLEAKNALRFVIGYARPFGKGKIIHIGSNPSPLLLKLILGQERKGPHVTCLEKGMNTNIHRHEDGSLLLFVTNRTPESKGAINIYLNLAKLGINPNTNYVVEELTGSATIKRKGKELNVLPVVVRPHDVCILKISQGGAREGERGAEEIR